MWLIIPIFKAKLIKESCKLQAGSVVYHWRGKHNEKIIHKIKKIEDIYMRRVNLTQHTLCQPKICNKIIIIMSTITKKYIRLIIMGHQVAITHQIQERLLAI